MKYRAYKEFFQPFIQEVEAEVKTILADQQRLPQMTYDDILAFVEKGSRDESEKIYFQRRKNAVAMALYLQWQYDEKVLRCFKNLVWDICQEYSWSLPAHFLSGEHETTIDLFAAETAHMLTEFTTLFADEFEPLLLNEIKKEVERRLLTPFLNKEWNWEKFENNWSAVCAGCIGMVVLVMDVEASKKHAILKRCLNAMEYFKKGYGDDGCCTEGVSYWTYGFGFYLYFAERYESQLGISILADKKIKAIATFPSKVAWSTEQYIPFSDTVANVHIPSGIRSFLSKRFQIPHMVNERITSFHFDHCYRWAHLSRVLWWSEHEELSVLTEEQPSGHFFPDAGWLVFKGNDVFFAAKGGHNDESHNHNDLGSFVFGIGDELTLVDFGAGAYCADYFNDKRYTHIHTRSDWHSTLTINQQEQKHGITYQAKVEAVEITQEGCKFKLDLSNVYDNKNVIKRSFQLAIWAQRLSIIDEAEVAHYQANFVMYEKPTIKDKKIIWQQLSLDYDSEIFDVIIEEAVAINHFNREEVIYALRMKAKKQCQQYEFVFTGVDDEND